MALFHVHRLRRHELRVEPGGLGAIVRRRLQQRPGPGVLVAELHAVLPVDAVRARGKTPLRCAVLVHDRQAFLHEIGGEGRIGEHLLGDLALRWYRTGFREGHALGSSRRIGLHPVEIFLDGVDRGRAVGVAAARDAGSDGPRVLVDLDAPLVDRLAVRDALVAVAGHRQPGIGEAPAQRRVLLAVVHVAIDLLAVDLAAGEELGDVLIGRPVDRNAEFVAVLGLEVRLVLLVVEPVVAEPIEVRELLIGKLVELAVRRGREGFADEVVDVEVGVGDVLALVRHEVGQAAGLLVAPVRADQVRVVDIGVIDVLARLHLRLQFFDHVAFADQVMGDLDAGDRGKGGCQNLRFVFMRGDRFGNDLDLHAGKRLCRIDEPLHFRFLGGAVERGHVADFLVQELLCLVHPGKCRAGKCQQHSRRRCQKVPSH